MVKVFKQIKSRISKCTNTFDSITIEKEITIVNNLINVRGIEDGEWVITGAVDTDQYTAGCINTVHNFSNGVATAECFFGDEESTLNIVFHKIDIFYAMNKVESRNITLSKKPENKIIVYENSLISLDERNIYSESIDPTLNVRRSIGVVFQINIKEPQEMYSSILDKIFINVVNGIIPEDYETIIRFESVSSRVKIEDAYVVDYNFYYIEEEYECDVDKKEIADFLVDFEKLEITEVLK